GERRRERSLEIRQEVAEHLAVVAHDYAVILDAQDPVAVERAERHALVEPVEGTERLHAAEIDQLVVERTRREVEVPANVVLDDRRAAQRDLPAPVRSEEHTSELQS